MKFQDLKRLSGEAHKAGIPPPQSMPYAWGSMVALPVPLFDELLAVVEAVGSLEWAPGNIIVEQQAVVISDALAALDVKLGALGE